MDSMCLLASYSVVKGDKLRLSQRSMGHDDCVDYIIKKRRKGESVRILQEYIVILVPDCFMGHRPSTPNE